MQKAPIVYFAYNRPSHTELTLNALKSNTFAEESDLIIYSDGPKTHEDIQKIAEVREILKKIEGFKSVSLIERSVNVGLYASIVEGVTDVVNKYGRVIVLEDDILVSPFFLKFMNEALTCYEHEKKVISIHAYVFPVDTQFQTSFFLYNTGAWGWATWKRGWDLFECNDKLLLEKLRKEKLLNKFNFNNTYPFAQLLKKRIKRKNQSWAILWYASALLASKLTLYPPVSLAANIGHDGTGTHSGKSNLFDTKMEENSPQVSYQHPEENLKAREAFERYYRKIYPNILKRVYRRLRKIF